MNILEKIVEEFSIDENIEAIVLGGSTSVEKEDELSDFDIYIYSKEDIDINFRRKIAETFSDEFEINNQFFETGDEWVLRGNKKVIDIMYRKCRDIEASIDWTWNKFGACVGYTTCFVFNIKNSKILYDKNGWFKNLQKNVSGEYPEKLAENIIAKNLPLLKFKLVSSYIEQVEKAIKRNDEISINHRISAFLASYFDILFAKNKILHCGEKRLLDYALKNCKILPKNFEKDMKNLFKNDKMEVLNSLADNLKNII